MFVHETTIHVSIWLGTTMINIARVGAILARSRAQYYIFGFLRIAKLCLWHSETE